MAGGGFARALEVLFKGDSKDLTRAADEADRSIAGVDDSAHKAGGGGGGLAKWGAAAGVAAVGVGAAVAVAWDFASAAMEDEKSALSLANTLKKSAGATDEQVKNLEKWISTQSKLTATADDELRPALQRLAASTGNAGRAAELLEHAQDIAAGTGKDLGAVTEALAKAAQGNVGGLARLGLQTEDFAGKQLTLDQILTDATGKFQGLAAEAAGGTSGAMAKASLAVGELKESIGAFLLPVIGKLATAFTEDLLPAVEKAIAWIQEHWPEIQEAIEPVLSRIVELVTVVAAEVMRIFEGPLGKALIEIVKFSFGQLLQVIKPALDLIIDLVRLVGAVLSGDWKQAWEAAQAVVGDAVKLILSLVDTLWDRFLFVFRALEDVITAPFKAALKFVQDLWDKTIGKLKLPSWAESLNPFQASAPQTARGVPGVPTGSTGPGIVINLPVGADPYLTVNALRTAGARVGGLDLAAVALR